MNFKSMIGCALLLVSGLAVANPGFAPRGTGEAPAAMLKDGVQALLGFIRQRPRPDAAAVSEFLDREVAPHFDFEYMARSVAGPLARRMSAEQRAALTADLRQRFLGKLAERLAGFDGQGVRYQRAVMGRDGVTASAGIVILNRGSYPARIDFRLYRTEQGWLVYDVAANGQSAIVHYRRALRRQLRGQMRPRGYGAGYPGGVPR